jgi:hypothetical protein
MFRTVTVAVRPSGTAQASHRHREGENVMQVSQSSSEDPRLAASAKKAYEKPAFRFENVFVTSALSCGKVSPTQANCASNMKVS